MLLSLHCGCKVNQYETNSMIQSFEEKGYEIVKEGQSADVYVINTCTVTNMSDKKSRQMLRHAKTQNPNAVIVAVGCYAQVAKEKLEQMEEIDLVLGNREKKEIVSYVEAYIENHQKEGITTDLMKEVEYNELGTTTYTEKTRAVIKVQDGCDRFCSYCIIPYARGRVRSRKPENVIEEITQIAKQGIQEVVITGIHIASYGKDFQEEFELIDLLEEINKVEGIKRIRLGSIESKMMTPEVVQRLSKLEKICDHFHLSLQSGCDETLARMNRRYTTQEFKEIVSMLREAFPNVALTTDIIVGFPGETKEEFEKTYTFLKDVAFYQMHVFKYSPREGTKAAVMPDQVDGNQKEERSKRLITLSLENEIKKKKEYIGKTVEVLFEEREGDYRKGHTKNYIMVKVETQDEIENQIVPVEIVKLEGVELIGKIQKNY